MSEFGRRLRAAREERGLSQAEIGDGKYSASYISHLERGRRHPTQEAIEFLTKRLELPAGYLSIAEPRGESDAQAAAELAIAELRMHNALVDHDYDTVIALTEQIGTGPAGAYPSAWWSALRLKAEAYLLSGSYTACIDMTSQLLDSQLTQVSAQLRSSILSLRSRALRADGRLDEALACAVDAVECAHESDSPYQLVTALLAEIAAEAELGQLEPAQHAAERLSVAREGLPGGQLTGLAAWAIGNVWFLVGRVEAAIAEHDDAARHLRAESDLRAWSRFYKASAAMRLTAGATDGVDEMIERAQQGLALVGNEADRAELQLLRAERALDDDPDRTLELVEEAVAVDLPKHTLAEADVLRSRAYERLEREADVRTALIHAAELFEAAGAHQRATAIWRRLVSGPEQ